MAVVRSSEATHPFKPTTGSGFQGSSSETSNTLSSGATWEQGATSWMTRVPCPSDEAHLIILHSMNACNAMVAISDILQLGCSARHRLYHPTRPHPPSLEPTALQKVVPHHAYIDMIPFPTIRDRILETMTVINEEELCRDLVSEDWRV